MTDSPLTGVPLMPTNTLKNETIFNRGLVTLESLLYRSVQSRSLTNPPTGSPSVANGQMWLVPEGSPTAVGDWSGQGDKVALYYDGWHFIPPGEGLYLWVVDEAQTIQYRSGAWISVDEFPPTLIGDLDDVNTGGSPTVTHGDVLVYDSVTGKWINGSVPFLGARAYQTSAQSVGSSPANLQLDDASTAPGGFDTAGAVDLANDRFVIPASLDGRYGTFTGGLKQASTPSQAFHVIRVSSDSGSSWTQMATSDQGGDTSGRSSFSTGPVRLTAGDWWELRVASASSINTDVSEPWCFLALAVH